MDVSWSPKSHIYWNSERLLFIYYSLDEIATSTIARPQAPPAPDDVRVSLQLL
jgi:hypothetical protein